MRYSHIERLVPASRQWGTLRHLGHRSPEPHFDVDNFDKIDHLLSIRKVTPHPSGYLLATPWLPRGYPRHAEDFACCLKYTGTQTDRYISFTSHSHFTTPPEVPVEAPVKMASVSKNAEESALSAVTSDNVKAPLFSSLLSGPRVAPAPRSSAELQ